MWSWVKFLVVGKEMFIMGVNVILESIFFVDFCLLGVGFVVERDDGFDRMGRFGVGFGCEG